MGGDDPEGTETSLRPCRNCRGTATTLILVGPRPPARLDPALEPQRLMLTAAAALGTLILIGLFVDSLRAGPPKGSPARPAQGAP